MVLGIRSIGSLLVVDIKVGQKNRGIMPQFLQPHHLACRVLTAFKPWGKFLSLIALAWFGLLQDSGLAFARGCAASYTFDKC
jgi:hypothetical protein